MAGGYDTRQGNASNPGAGQSGNSGVNNESRNPNIAQVDVTAMMAQLIQVVQNNNNSNQQSNQGDPFARRNKEFGTLGGKSFSGENGAVAAEAWIQGCEVIFGRMQLTEVQKQELAVHQLEGAARFWWNSILPGLNVANLTWTDFKGRFEAQFIPNAVKSKMMNEFLNLKQEGNMTVTQYVTKFNELSRHAPDLVSTVQKRNVRFIQGLLPHLHRQLIPFDSDGFDRVLDLALKYEEQGRQFKEGRDKGKGKVGETSRSAGPHHQQRDQNRDQNRYRPYNQGQRGHHNQQRGQGFQRHGGNPNRQGNNRQGQQGQYGQQFQAPHYHPAGPPGAAPPVAPGGRAPFTGTCHTCGQVGHKSYQCTVGRKNQQGGPGQVAPARAFTIFPRHDNMQGTLDLFHSNVRVLFDTGASHSFIARQLVTQANVKTTPLPVPLCVETPLGGSVTLYEQCKNFEISLFGRTFYADLIVLGFEGFSFILGMDWLRTYRVTLDCAGRKISINAPGMPSVTHSCGTSGESVMSSFLYSVEIPKKDLKDVEVVRDFEDVFQEIPGLPPKREVEFRIDLVPGTASISKAAYRLAPKELKEMKVQLEEMLQKGYVYY